MKNVWIFLLVLLIPITVSARDIEMGTVEITGTTRFDLGWSSVDSDAGDADTDTIGLDVDAQYYFVKNLAVGGFFNYEDIDVDRSPDNTRWLIGPQVTYNISYDDQLNFFVNGGVAYADYEIAGISGDGFGFRVGGGAKYFLTRSIALVGQLKYTWLSMDRDIDVDELNFGAGLSVFF